MANPISVVSPKFLSPDQLDLTIVKKPVLFSCGDFTVTDVNGKLMFNVKGEFMSHNKRSVLFDAAHNPILSFHKKLWNPFNRWEVFKGDSSSSNDLIFSTHRPLLTDDVFLAHNKKEDVCDFKVKRSWFDKSSCTIFAGDGTTIIAQMKKELTLRSFLCGEDKFNVTVYPNVDHVFVVTLGLISQACIKPQ